MRLENKVVVVTGASAGMGREMALTFAREGAKVLAVARREDVLLELCQEAADCPGSIEAIVGDCSQKDVCEKMIATAVEKYGRLDSLVNNAGIMDDTTAVGDFKDEYLEKIYNLNTFGVLYSMRAAVKQLLTQECDEEKGRGEYPQHHLHRSTARMCRCSILLLQGCGGSRHEAHGFYVSGGWHSRQCDRAGRCDYRHLFQYADSG